MQSLKYLGVALTAGLVGASVALLMAPASGRDTRRKIGRRLDDEKRELLKKMNREKEHLLRKGRETLEGVTDYVVDELEDAQKKFAKMVRG